MLQWGYRDLLYIAHHLSLIFLLDYLYPIYNHSFLEFQHVITDARRFNSPLSMEKAVERTWFWIDHERIKIIYPTENSLKRALLWCNMFSLGRKRIQDTHMAAAFAEAGVSELWTANPSDFEILEAFDIVDYS